MKMSIRYFLSMFLSSMLLFISCEDDNSPDGRYDKGVFIVNEGAFLAGNGSITYYNPISGAIKQNIFINPAGDFAGDVVQSLIFNEDKAYVVVNGDNKIEVVNASTFKSIQTIVHPDLDKPRYVEIINGKAYISVWGAYDEFFSLIDSYVLVYDLTSNTVVKKIDTNEGTENLLYNGQRLFASNYNYGSSSTVSVINPSDNSLVGNIQLEAGPAGMVIDANGKLWVVCVGGWGAANGQLFRVNPETLVVEDMITITGVPGMDIATTPDKQNIIYSVGTSVFSIPVSATEAPSVALFNAENVVSNYSLSVDQSNGDIWIGDAPSFSSTGKVYSYSSSGVFSNSFDAGIGPTQIVFKQ